MSIDKTCITSVTDAKIATANSSCATCDLVALSATTNRIITDRKSYVTLACNLPDLNLGTTPEGTMFYVQELGIPVVATDQAWTGLDGRTYRKDVPDSQLWAWGCNLAGTLGVNNITNYSSPIQEISFSTNWRDITAGRSSFGIKTDGTLWGWGCGTFGAIGNGIPTNYSSPVQEASSSANWCGVSATNFHALAVKTDSTLWAWGYNFCGRLGDGTAICRSTPVQEITSSTNWIAVSAGYDHSLAIKNDGTLWGWGCNNRFQLGNGTSTNTSSPVQEASSFTDWCLASGGCRSSIAITTSGKLYGWGCGAFGILGVNCNNNPISPTQEISSSTNWNCSSVGAAHTISTKADGTLWAWGNGFYGKLGVNSVADFSSPVQEITSSTDWCSMASHHFHSIGIKISGELYAWGFGGTGQLGNSATIDQSSPVQEITSSTNWCVAASGLSHTIAIKQVV